MLYRASVYLHVLAACLWVGGILFFALVLVPALRGSRSTTSLALVQEVGRRFRLVGWASLGVLVVTGVANLSFRVFVPELLRGAFWASPWGRLLALKLALVASMIGVAALHDWYGARALLPAMPDAEGLRRTASRLGRVLGVLALAIVYVAVLLVRGC
jgi:putative copper resistance protein D